MFLVLTFCFWLGLLMVPSLASPENSDNGNHDEGSVSRLELTERCARGGDCGSMNMAEDDEDQDGSWGRCAEDRILICHREDDGDHKKGHHGGKFQHHKDKDDQTMFCVSPHRAAEHIEQHPNDIYGPCPSPRRKGCPRKLSPCPLARTYDTLRYNHTGDGLWRPQDQGRLLGTDSDLLHTLEVAGSAIFGDIEGTNVASGPNSIAAGTDTKAQGPNSFATGDNTVARTFNSASFGDSTIAGATNAVSEGLCTRAFGEQSSTSGTGTFAGSDSSMAVGRCNEDTGALFMVGNGSPGRILEQGCDCRRRSNILEVNQTSVLIRGNLEVTGSCGSCTGDSGEPGPQGEQGVPGPPGEQGPEGNCTCEFGNGNATFVEADSDFPSPLLAGTRFNVTVSCPPNTEAIGGSCTTSEFLAGVGISQSGFASPVSWICAWQCFTLAQPCVPVSGPIGFAFITCI